MWSSPRVFRSIVALVASVGVFAATASASAEPATNAADLPRIRGGDVAVDGSHPYAARLDVFSGSRYLGRCSGAVIGSRWVATAAHCVTEFRLPGSPIIRDLKVEVVIGTPQTAPAPGAPGAVTASHAITHPGFDLQAQGLRDDFALLRLDTAVATPTLGLVDLGEVSELAPPGAAAEAIGWGIEGPLGSSAERLRQAPMPLIGDPTCADLDPYGQFVDETMICAGSVPSERDAAGTCPGDSGGPLMVRDALGYPRLLGVTSWGFDVTCATGPDVFSEVPALAPPVLEAARRDEVAPLAPPTIHTQAFGRSTEATLSLIADAGNLATRYEATLRGGGETQTVRGELFAGRQTRLTPRFRGLQPATRYAVSVKVSNALGSATDELVVTTDGVGAAA